MRLAHRQLEIFQSLMQTLNVTETASLLCSSQPTISRELKELEALLGFPLFHRQNRRLEPSQQGIALNVIVQRSFVSIEEIARTAKAIREDSFQRVSVACLPAFAHALIPQVVEHFLAEFPNTSIKIHSLEESALTRDLVSKFFDIGIVEGRFDRAPATTLELYAGDLLCIMPSSHPLARYEVLEAKYFDGHDFIYYSDEDSYRRQVDMHFESANVKRRLLVETTTATSIGSLVRAGIGLSIVNPFSALAFRGDGVVVRRLAQPIPYHVNVWQPEPSKRGVFGSHFVEAIEIVVAAAVATLSTDGLCSS